MLASQVFYFPLSPRLSFSDMSFNFHWTFLSKEICGTHWNHNLYSFIELGCYNLYFFAFFSGSNAEYVWFVLKYSWKFEGEYENLNFFPFSHRPRQQQHISGVCAFRYIGEIISDCEADHREDDSYLFDLDNRVSNFWAQWNTCTLLLDH